MMDEQETRVSKNGYQYTKLGPGNWKLTHHLVAGKKLGRPIDTSIERVCFEDGDRTNLSPENIVVIPKSVKTASLVLARLKKQETDLTERLAYVRQRIKDIEKGVKLHQASA